MTVALTPYSVAFLCAAISALIGVLYRFNMRAQIDAWALSFINSLAGGLVLITLLPAPQWTFIDPLIGTMLFASGLIWMLMVYWDLLAYEELEASVNALMNTTRLIVQCSLGVFLFEERFNLQAIAGICLIIAAIYSGVRSGLIRWNRSALFRGLSIISGMVALTIDKYLTTIIPYELVLLSGYFIPATLFLIIRPRTLMKSLGTIRKFPFLSFANITLFSIVGFTLVYSIAHGGFGATTAILQSSTFFAFVFGVLFLKETSKWQLRLLASLLSMAGAILVAYA